MSAKLFTYDELSYKGSGITRAVPVRFVEATFIVVCTPVISIPGSQPTGLVWLSCNHKIDFLARRTIPADIVS